MRTLLCIVSLLLSPAFADAQTVEEATVRVYVYDDGDDRPDSMGSGVLVTDNRIITNNHVVKDCRRGNRPVMVRFPDGWRSWATIEMVDKEWDLALLWINPHPTIKPVVAGTMPQAGDTLTLQGLGGDYEYKAQVGKMDKAFYGPENSSGDGWLKVLGVAARQGDSGGPITNAQGQWVGNLFGSENSKEYGTYTMGSHIGLIKKVFGQRLKVSPGTNYNFMEQ